MKNFILKLSIILIIVGIALLLGLIPIWPQTVKSGVIKINTFEKIQVALGILYMD